MKLDFYVQYFNASQLHSNIFFTPATHMDTELNILLLEDSEPDAELLKRFLKNKSIPFTMQQVSSRDGFVSALDIKPDLIIADQALPGFSGIEAFRIVKQKRLAIPFILVTGSVSEELLTDFAKEGIDDYLFKDNLLRLPASIENVINRRKLESLYRDLQQAHQDIKDSINYGKLIQEAVLPDRKILHSVFPKSYIIYKPKDVLSGDFYWFGKFGPNFIFAVADCTGHGVPGALLAVMGNNLINDLVALKRLSSPSDILTILNIELTRILRKRFTHLHDGMDIALCAINIETKELRYAGANRPLLVDRMGELTELKASKTPIGSTVTHSKFQEQKMILQPGDRLFVFSDGYADQFHHASGKKILSKRLKQIISTTNNLPISSQKTIITNFFNRWKGNNEQVDDVLLLCIEIGM